MEGILFNYHSFSPLTLDRLVAVGEREVHVYSVGPHPCCALHTVPTPVNPLLSQASPLFHFLNSPHDSWEHFILGLLMESRYHGNLLWVAIATG